MSEFSELPPLLMMFTCFDLLRRNGWRDDVGSIPANGSPCLFIEPGSTGIHRGYRDTAGYWVVDDQDTYPSRPILWRRP